MKFFKKEKNLVKPVVVGIIVLVILVSIPFVGGLIKLLATLLGLGTITLAIFTRKKARKKKR